MYFIASLLPAATLKTGGRREGDEETQKIEVKGAELSESDLHEHRIYAPEERCSYQHEVSD